MFKKRKLKKELKSFCKFVCENGRDAIYQTEIVRCYQMPSKTFFIVITDGFATALGYDNHDQFHYID